MWVSWAKTKNSKGERLKCFTDPILDTLLGVWDKIMHSLTFKMYRSYYKSFFDAELL